MTPEMWDFVKTTFPKNAYEVREQLENAQRQEKFSVPYSQF